MNQWSCRLRPAAAAILVFAFCWGAVLRSQADPVPTSKLDVGPVAVEVDVASQTIGLSEPLEISFTLLAPQNVEMKWPDLSAGTDGYRIIDTRTDGPDLLGRFQARRWHVRVEPLRLGELKLPSAKLEYRTGNEEWTTGEIPVPAVLVVPGPTSSADPQTLRPLPVTEAAGAAATGGLFRWLRYAGLIIAAIFGPWALFTYLKSRSGQRTALDEATAELDQVEKNAANADPRAVVAQVADLIRRHLERAHGISALQQSTPEILDDPKTVTTLTLAQREGLAEFFAAADIEKFAAREPTPEEARLCIRRARAYLGSEKS